MTTARRVAAHVLHRSRSREAFAAELIDDALAATPLSPQDRRFVTQLVFGVIRRRGTLDALLKPFIQIPFHAVQPRVWDVLHLGAFQLVFLTHVPKHAAVNETVELANHIGAPKAKGFVNGVMRRVAELVTDEFADRAGADAVPVDLGGGGGGGPGGAVVPVGNYDEPLDESPQSPAPNPQPPFTASADEPGRRRR
jgi:16S rRNA (cytosine967-C5)-methyltransferase